MDEQLDVVIEMNAWTWDRFKNVLADMTEDEANWRPLPQANNINVIIRHLRIEAEWHVDSIERGELMPAEVTPKVQELIDATPLDFDKNVRELEELYRRFISAMKALTRSWLSEHSAKAYREFPGRHPAHLLSFHQAVHLAGHQGQIATIRNLYRKTRGERALFFPDNPTFPKS